MAKKILIVEDERNIVDILAFNLCREGYEVLSASDGESGQKLIREFNPDLVLLDIMLPGLDGFAVCRQLREGGSGVPVIMLTARDDESDMVFGLELGADDYITKPFSMRELLARVRTNIRRAEENPDSGDVLHSGALSLHPGRMEAFKNDVALSLTGREYDLLFFLMRQPDRVFSRESLMREVWDYEYMGDLRTVDVTVRRLREKIEDDPSQPRYLLTRRGQGYLFARP